jgi:carbonic anhydrase
VVLGHPRCGCIRAFADDTAPLSPGDFIGRWMSMIAPAGERVGPRGDMELIEYATRLEFAAIELSLRNLMTFPCVKILVERGKLQLHGAYFGVANGVLLVRDPDTGTFKPAVEDVPERVSMFSAREVKG